MKTANCSRLAVILIMLIGVDLTADAAAQTTEPSTLWSFLGIPQGLQKIRDATVNRKGKHPKLERKPPLKSIADPSHLESDDPAIKEAAKIKTQEDMAKQKIKAIKYLATVGCGCYPGVKEALLDAMEDCTEEVRYEAAVALCQAAGDHCDICDSSCCDAATMSKLHEKAFGKRANGCFIESSARVRAAAENALNACRRRVPRAPAEVPPENGKEYPTEAPPLETPPSDAGPPWIEERGLEEKKPSSEGQNKTSAIMKPVSLAGLSQAGESEITDQPTTAYTGAYGRPCARGRSRCGGPETCIIPDGTVGPLDVGEAAPGEAAPGAPYAPSPGTFASGYGAAAGPQAAAPYMIGDFFGCGSSRVTMVRSFAFAGLDTEDDVPPSSLFYTIIPASGTRVALQDWNDPLSPTYTILDFNDASARLGGPPLAAVPAGGTLLPGGTTIEDFNETFVSQFRVAYTADIPCPARGVVGRMKIAENTSPIPRDRLLFNYSFFENVPLRRGGVGVHRFTPGFEKTFQGGLASFEMKIPMAVTLDNNVMQDGGTDLSSGEFGNMALTYKRLLVERGTWALSGGLTVAVPTADDTRLLAADGTSIVEIHNESVYLQPFFGLLWTPNDRLFAQAFMQWDVAANGNPILIYDRQQQGLTYVDDIHDTVFQYVDVGLGYWAYRSCERSRRLTGLAWTAELHWNRSLKDKDIVTYQDFRVGDFSTNIEVINLTLGAHLELFDKTMLTLAYATPLGGGRDQQFDGEFRLMLNRRFGPQTRLTRTPFF